jgi:hypothetical protein
MIICPYVNKPTAKLYPSAVVGQMRMRITEEIQCNARAPFGVSISFEKNFQNGSIL